MALGLGRALGFACPENFNHPYAAVSITDFWRRWHISLSLWFRDYLYIPLGGSRRGKWRTALNKAVVFVLCGLWHGANLTFVVWGAWHGLLSALESLRVLDVQRWRRSAAGRLLSRVYTLLAVGLGFAMFRAESVAAGFTLIAAMFTGWDFTLEGTVLLQNRPRRVDGVHARPRRGLFRPGPGAGPRAPEGQGHRGGGGALLRGLRSPAGL